MSARAQTVTEALPRSADDVERGQGTYAVYVDENELHRRVAPHMGKDRFRAAVRVCELRGFPPVNPLWHGRYWPAVKRWLDDENGVGNDGCTGITQDGPENFDAPPKRRPGPEMGSPR
jgi:hypothetical protein